MQTYWRGFNTWILSCVFILVFLTSQYVPPTAFWDYCICFKWYCWGLSPSLCISDINSFLEVQTGWWFICLLLHDGCQDTRVKCWLAQWKVRVQAPAPYNKNAFQTSALSESWCQHHCTISLHHSRMATGFQRPSTYASWPPQTWLSTLVPCLPSSLSSLCLFFSWAYDFLTVFLIFTQILSQLLSTAVKENLSSTSKTPLISSTMCGTLKVCDIFFSFPQGETQQDVAGNRQTQGGKASL